MKSKQYELFETTVQTVPGFSYGKPVKVPFYSVIRKDIASSDRDEFTAMVKEQGFTEEELDNFRIGFVDSEGVGRYCGWEEFLGNTVVLELTATPVA